MTDEAEIAKAALEHAKSLLDFSEQLIGMVRESSEGWMSLWTLFHTIAAAIVAVVASDKLLPSSRAWVAFAAGALFVLFSAGNYTALSAIREQRIAVIEFVKTVSASEPAIKPSIERFADAAQPPSQKALRGYHWGMQALIVMLLFGLQFRSTRDKDDAWSAQTGEKKKVGSARGGEQAKN